MRPMNLAKLIWWKAFPPKYPSPYLYAPFSKHFRRILTHYASHSHSAVEFGRLNGYSTNIILDALPPSSILRSYDKDPFCWSHGKDPRLLCYCGDMFDTIPYLPLFDFMWIDVAADNPTIEKAYQLLHPHLKRGAVIITEGHKRRNERVLKPSFPFEQLTSSPPGLFRFLP